MKLVQSHVGKVVLIGMAMTFAVVSYGQVYRSVPTAPPPETPPPEFSGSPFIGPKASPGEDLSGKVLCIMPKSFFGLTYEIENPKCSTIAGRTFLVGKAIDADVKSKKPSPIVGATVWIPIDEVGSIHAFNSVEQLRKARLLLLKWQPGYHEVAPAGAPIPALEVPTSCTPSRLVPVPVTTPPISPRS